MSKLQNIIHLNSGGTFQLESLLAQTSTTEIWAATWQENGEPVAVKKVNEALIQQTSPDLKQHVIASLHAEKTILERIRSAHLLRFYRHGEVNDFPVLVFEQLQCTLKQAFEESLPSLTQTLEWFRQIAQGLQTLHQQGYRHLDIKPSNIMLGITHQVQRARIVDFGTSRFHEPISHPLSGTIGWMAPEQFFPAMYERNRYFYCTDYRSDIYALGLLLFFMLTGKNTAFASQCAALHKLNPEHGAWAKRWQLNANLSNQDHALLSTSLTDLIAQHNGNQHLDPMANLIQQLLTPEHEAIQHLLNSLIQTDASDRLKDLTEVLASVHQCQCILAQTASNTWVKPFVNRMLKNSHKTTKILHNLI